MSDREEKVSASSFSIYAWSDKIPLTDDLWLGMQARNIAIVDMTIMRQIEASALEEFFHNDRYSVPTLLTLSALSQMWVFSLYEFLRTWLDRASKLIGYSERLAQQKTDEERIKYQEKITAELQERAKHVKFAPVFYLEHVARVADKEFIQTIRAYRDSIKELFRDVEAIRMPLAKHEIAGTKGRNFIAEAPGYGRVSNFTGSMYWQIVLTDGTVGVIERRRLADKFLGIKSEYEEEIGEEQPKKERRQRMGRRGGRRNRAKKSETKAAPEGDTQ